LSDFAHLRENGVVLPDTPCPPDADEVAEAFVLRRLGENEAEEFRAHVRTCRKCEQTLSDARAFVAALKAAHENGDSE
jgi:hypothetical protein